MQKKANLYYQQHCENVSVFINDRPHSHVGKRTGWGIKDYIIDYIKADYPKGVNTCSKIRFNLDEQYKVPREELVLKIKQNNFFILIS